jgi:2-phosphosulfolactate phosphatase
VLVTVADLDARVQADGSVVVIDVLRAFTTSAFAFAAGAATILPVASVDEALRLRAEGHADMAMGEVGGAPVAGFDLSNSPAGLDGLRLDGARLAFRTTHGTQGVVRAMAVPTHPPPTARTTVFVASFVVAGATARAVVRGEPAAVTLLVTGSGRDRADEDRACADYLAALLAGDAPDPKPYLARARSSATAAKFGDPAYPQYPPADLPLCMDLDRFDFAMRVTDEGGRRVVRAVRGFETT